nr:uncharacterized protein LOC113827814 [Penaeus vannamei]
MVSPSVIKSPTILNDRVRETHNLRCFSLLKMFLVELVARQVSCRSASTGLSGWSGRARALVLTLRMAKVVVRASYGRSLSGQFGLVTPGDLEGDLEPDRVVLYLEQAVNEIGMYWCLNCHVQAESVKSFELEGF